MSHSKLASTVVKLDEGKSLVYTGSHLVPAMMLLNSRMYSKALLEFAMKKEDCRVSTIWETKEVQAFLLESRAYVQPYVVKTANAHRARLAAPQFGAEGQAALAFRHTSTGLLCPPAKVDIDGDFSMTISVYAGESLDKLLAEGGAWSTLSKRELLQKAREVGMGLVKAKALLEAVPANKGGSAMHRDIKPANVFVRMVDGVALPVLMDFGGFCQDTNDCHSIISMQALDPLLAEVNDDGVAAADSAAGMRAMTHPSADLAQIGLIIAQVLGRGLPAAVDPFNYDLTDQDSTRAFYQGVREFDWGAWAVEQGHPADAKDLLVRCLSRDLSIRFSSAAEAAQHPFLAVVDGKMQQAEEAVLEQWEAAQKQLRSVLADSNNLMRVYAAASDAEEQRCQVLSTTEAAGSSSSKGPTTPSGSSIDVACSAASLLAVGGSCTVKPAPHASRRSSDNSTDSRPDCAVSVRQADRKTGIQNSSPPAMPGLSVLSRPPPQHSKQCQDVAGALGRVQDDHEQQDVGVGCSSSQSVPPLLTHSNSNSSRQRGIVSLRKFHLARCIKQISRRCMSLAMSLAMVEVCRHLGRACTSVTTSTTTSTSCSRVSGKISLK